MCDSHPWKLTAPWWRWPRLKVVGKPDAAERQAVRTSAPVLQKYDTSDPVSLFVKEPQKALVYVADDEVQKIEAVAAPPPGSKRTSLSSWVATSTKTRKLFLPLHKRFYLVVCELHCDTPGFPAVSRDKVCEAGFVVRRRRLSVPGDKAPEALALVKEIGRLTGEIARLDKVSAGRTLKKRVRVTRGGVFGAMAGAAGEVKSKLREAVDDAAARRRTALTDELIAVRVQLKAWGETSGQVALTEGWVASGSQNVGQWQMLGDTPEEVSETVYPLYPLVPDPRADAHDATGKTLYFGMLPVSSREVDPTGTARFDDTARYEVRCFVRRHRCDCPKTGERNDCGGEVVWSEPTTVFQIAAPFDPVGTGNHPITIQLPDIPALAATPARLPVKMVSPPGSAMAFQVDDDGKPQDGRLGGMPQICFFSIPLITIVATFVLMLFLPIVVFVFQLWFLLGLKFCIPPSISFSAGADVHLDIEGELAIAADLDVDVLLAADIGLAGLGDSGLLDTVGPGGIGREDMSPPVFVDNGGPQAQIRDTFARPVLEDLRARVTEDRTDEVEADDLLAALVYEERVERWEVGA